VAPLLLLVPCRFVCGLLSNGCDNPVKGVHEVWCWWDSLGCLRAEQSRGCQIRSARSGVVSAVGL
jgi:hypothetical protein